MKIESIEQTKIDQIAQAQMPISGLSFDDTGVLFEEIPFVQLSSSQQLKVSIAMAMAMNPEIRVIRITDGSLLDTTNMAIIHQMAEDNDFQIWIEQVDESGEVGIYIEEGEIPGQDLEPEPEESPEKPPSKASQKALFD